MRRKARALLLTAVLTASAASIPAAEPLAPAGEVVRPTHERYAARTDEVPDFRRHVSPLLGRLGCNGRSCHGSLQGKGGFRLSLFGYDYKADHEAILSGGLRADVKKPADSLILHKPTHAEEHGGGERMKAGTWPYHLIRRWIESGARGIGPGQPQLSRLEISPPEILFSKESERAALRVVAHWSDGAREDVTPLCRYQSRDEALAEVDADGAVTSKGRGDTDVIVFYDTEVAVVPVLRPVSAKIGASYPDVDQNRRPDRGPAPQARHRSVGSLLRQRVSPPCQPRHDRDAADAARGRGIPGGFLL
jgi:hypothetical protein